MFLIFFLENSYLNVSRFLYIVYLASPIIKRNHFKEVYVHVTQRKGKAHMKQCSGKIFTNMYYNEIKANFYKMKVI